MPQPIAHQYEVTQSTAPDAEPPAPEGKGWRCVFDLVAPALRGKARVCGWARDAADDSNARRVGAASNFKEVI